MHDALLAEAEAVAVAAAAKCRADATTTTVLLDDPKKVHDDGDPSSLLLLAEAVEAAAAEAQEARRRVAALVIQKSAMSHMAKQEMKRHARSQTLAQKCDRARVVDDMIVWCVFSLFFVVFIIHNNILHIHLSRVPLIRFIIARNFCFIFINVCDCKTRRRLCIAASSSIIIKTKKNMNV